MAHQSCTQHLRHAPHSKSDKLTNHTHTRAHVHTHMTQKHRNRKRVAHAHAQCLFASFPSPLPLSSDSALGLASSSTRTDTFFDIRRTEGRTEEIKRDKTLIPPNSPLSIVGLGVERPVGLGDHRSLKGLLEVWD